MIAKLTEDDHELEDEPGEEEGALVELDAEHDEDVGQDADGVEHQKHGEHHVEGGPETQQRTWYRIGKDIPRIRSSMPRLTREIYESVSINVVVMEGVILK